MRHEIALADRAGKQFGPAMSKLSMQEQVFVCLLFEGAANATDAWRKAGFKSQGRSAGAEGRMASYYTSLPRIIAAIKEEDQRRVVLMGTKANTALGAILANPQHADHFKAIKLIRDDAGMTKAVEKVVNVNVRISPEEKVEKIRLWAAAKGLDVEKLLGYSPEPLALDAEFAEVETEEDVHDLEDLL